jgi:hypothetical protein
VRSSRQHVVHSRPSEASQALATERKPVASSVFVLACGCVRPGVAWLARTQAPSTIGSTVTRNPRKSTRSHHARQQYPCDPSCNPGGSQMCSDEFAATCECIVRSVDLIATSAPSQRPVSKRVRNRPVLSAMATAKVHIAPKPCNLQTSFKRIFLVRLKPACRSGYGLLQNGDRHATGATAAVPGTRNEPAGPVPWPTGP